jgi:hypothetical protein
MVAAMVLDKERDQPGKAMKISDQVSHGAEN